MDYPPYFVERELACRCGCGACRMDEGFMRKLTALREACGFPFVVTSGYRCEAHNQAVGGAAKSAHAVGRAVDIRVYGGWARRLVIEAERFGMTGVGLMQHGPIAGRFVHLDDLDDDPQAGIPRPWIWTYDS